MKVLLNQTRKDRGRAVERGLPQEILKVEGQGHVSSQESPETKGQGHKDKGQEVARLVEISLKKAPQARPIKMEPLLLVHLDQGMVM